MERSQIRAARALLGWTQAELAAQAGLSVPTIKRIEPGSGPVPVSLDTAERIVRALEQAGVSLISPGKYSSAAGSGVRFREMPWDVVPEQNMFSLVQRAILKKQKRLLELLRDGSVNDPEVQELIAEIDTHLKSATARQDLE